jgi:hypothetical protein
MSFAPLPEFKPKLIPQPRKGKQLLLGPVPDGFEGHEVLASPGSSKHPKHIGSTSINTPFPLNFTF